MTTHPWIADAVKTLRFLNDAASDAAFRKATTVGQRMDMENFGMIALDREAVPQRWSLTREGAEVAS